MPRMPPKRRKGKRATTSSTTHRPLLRRHRRGRSLNYRIPAFAGVLFGWPFEHSRHSPQLILISGSRVLNGGSLSYALAVMIDD